MNKLETFLAVTITMVSGHTDKKQKEWREKNFSGCYHMVEIVNDRPAYKVTFIDFTIDLLVLNQTFDFSETKRLNMAMRCISGITGQNFGIYHMLRISKKEINQITKKIPILN